MSERLPRRVTFAASDPDAEYVDKAFDQYVETLLWSEVDYSDENGKPLPEDGAPEPFDAWATVDDVSPSTLRDMRSEVEDFIGSNWTILRSMSPEQVGQDFALTRNGHGTGFWDRGHGRVGDILTERSKPYGSANLYAEKDEHGRRWVKQSCRRSHE